MPQIDQSFVNGLSWRLLVIGLAVALWTTLMFSTRLGISVALGSATAAASLRATSFIIGRLFRGVLQGNPRVVGWVIILAMKMFILAVVIWSCLEFFDGQILAFVVGYKMIFPALIWQVRATPGHFHEESDHETEDPESL